MRRVIIIMIAFCATVFSAAANNNDDSIIVNLKKEVPKCYSLGCGQRRGHQPEQLGQ